jgi:signal transduction histidine kinase
MATQEEPTGPLAHQPPAFMRAPLEPSAAGMSKDRGPHWIDVRALCQRLVEEIAPHAERQKVTIDLSLCALPATVIGYTDELRGAVLRLLVNALNAMPRGGRLIVRVERDPYVTIECCDTGPERASTSRSEVRATIEAHRGYVWHRRHPGGGTCVIIELPAAGPRR